MVTMAEESDKRKIDLCYLDGTKDQLDEILMRDRPPGFRQRTDEAIGMARGHGRHRIAGLNQLAANVRQWPCRTSADVDQLFEFVARMATDCGWEPTAHEVVEQQRASRAWIRDRVLGQVAERTMEPYKLAALANAVLRYTRVERS